MVSCFFKFSINLTFILTLFLGLLSGYYSEDFEAMEYDDASDEDNNFDEDLDRYLNSSEDIGLEEDEDEDEDELTLSINDVEVQ